MSSAAAWRWSLVAGLLAFGCAWGFGRIPGMTACGGTGGSGPIIAFELARTPTEIAALFGVEPCRSTLVAAQRAGLWLDALGFIPSYTAFLCFASWATGGAARRWVIAALLVAGLSDEIEGLLLFSILTMLPGSPPLLGALFWVVRLKFLLLGVATLAVALLLLGRWRSFRLTEWTVARIVGGVGVGFGAVQALRGFFALPGAGMMMAGFAMAWFILLLVALFGAAWPLRQAPASRPPAPAPPSG